MSISDLPAVNASLNGLAALLLVGGYALIKTGHRLAHRNVMISAFAVSVAFLVCYVVYHFNTEVLTRFAGPASVRPFYLALLISHTILAAVVPVLCVITLYRAARKQFDRHRRIARITLPIWLYVSVTGVMIYLILYRIYPAAYGD